MAKTKTPTINTSSVAIVLAQEKEFLTNQLDLIYYLNLAKQLKEDGHIVEFIAISARSSTKDSGDENHSLLSELRDAGQKVTQPIPPRNMPNQSFNGEAAEVPYLTYSYLKDKCYDVVHFQDYLAPAYYYMLAITEGLIDSPACIAIHVWQPLIYRLLTGRTVIKDYSLPARCNMEKYCIEHAESVYPRFEGTLTDLRNVGYKLSIDKTFIAPDLESLSFKKNIIHNRDNKSDIEEIDELLYVSPISQSEGFTTFVYALDVLSARGITPKRVSILGPLVESFNGIEFLQRHREKWNFEVNYLPSLSLRTLQNKIESPGTLCVFPCFFRTDNMLLNVALSANRPFIATQDESLKNILEQQQLDEYIVDAHHLSLAKRLEMVLSNGITLPFTKAKKEACGWWKKQHTELLNRSRQSNTYSSKTNSSGTATEPLVSVCIAHFNRPESIHNVLNSLNNQTYENFEIIIVDDGSTEDNVTKLVRVLAKHTNVRLIRQENRYLGAVRNTGAREASGEYLLFMDDDNYAMPHEIETFVHVAKHSGADVLTCFSDLFSGEGIPNEQSIIPITRMPFGSDLYYGMFRNGYGDSNCFVRKSTWELLGGFTEHYRIGLDDHEFFTRVALDGHKLLAIPESLYYYRLAKNPMQQNHANTQADFLRILEPYLKDKFIDPELLPILFAARNAFNLR